METRLKLEHKDWNWLIGNLEISRSKISPKTKGLTHGFWWFFEQFQTIKITSKEEGFDNILTFCTDFSHFRTRSIWNFRLKIFTKKLPFIFAIEGVNPWFLTIFRPISNHRNILKTKHNWRFNHILTFCTDFSHFKEK